MITHHAAIDMSLPPVCSESYLASITADLQTWYKPEGADVFCYLEPWDMSPTLVRVGAVPG